MSLWRHLWPNYNTLDFNILTQCVKLLGERVLQVWWWYLHWFRRYRKKTRGGLEIAPPSGARVKNESARFWNAWHNYGLIRVATMWKSLVWLRCSWRVFAFRTRGSLQSLLVNRMSDNLGDNFCPSSRPQSLNQWRSGHASLDGVIVSLSVMILLMLNPCNVIWSVIFRHLREAPLLTGGL